MGTLSIPGGVQGVIELFNVHRLDGYALLHIISISGGGLLLLGYATALYRYLREQTGEVPREENFPEGKR
jgi:hypothetical protein